MGVPGEKLMSEEKFTQDFITTSGGATFVTPNTRENAKLQYWSLVDMTLYYFLNPKDSHLLDFFMQSLWNELNIIRWGSVTGAALPICWGRDRP